MKRARKKSIQGMLLLLPSFLGLSLFYFAPFVISVMYSFSRVSGRFVWAGLDNYRKTFSSGAFQTALDNTFRFLLIGIALMLTLGYLLSALTRQVSKRHGGLSSAGLACLLLPLMLPSGACLAFFQVMFQRFGAVNGLLERMGLPPRFFLESGDAFWVLMVFYLWKNMGYTIAILLSGLLSVPRDMLEAARVDGAGGPTLFFRFTLPHMLPFFSIGTVMNIIAAFKMYRESYLLMGMYPDRSVYMLQNFLNNHFVSLNYQRLSSATVMFVIALGLILWVLMRIGLRERT